MEMTVSIELTVTNTDSTVVGDQLDTYASHLERMIDEKLNTRSIIGLEYKCLKVCSITDVSLYYDEPDIDIDA